MTYVQSRGISLVGLAMCEAMGAESDSNRLDDVPDIGQSQGCRRTVLPAQQVWAAADISSVPAMTHCIRAAKVLNGRLVVLLPGSSLEGEWVSW